MSRFTPAQVTELTVIGRRMMTMVRDLLRDLPTEPEEFRALIATLSGRYGSDGAAFVIVGWIDQIAAGIPAADRAGIDGVGFIADDGTGLEHLGEQDSEYAWIASALAARLAEDQAELRRLFYELPRDGRITEYLLRTLTVTAGVLNEREHPPVGRLRAGDIVTVPTRGDIPWWPGVAR